jgi:hypothetical protein
VEAWPDEGAAPRDKEAVTWLPGALEAIVAITADANVNVSPMVRGAACWGAGACGAGTACESAMMKVRKT